MKALRQVFRLRRAKSGLFSEYDSGDVAYVGNSLDDNGVVGFVRPLPDDTVFQEPAIAVSAFCEATLQLPPFVACGRAGNGLVVLEPMEPMSLGQMAYYAAYINQAIRWRFNWYRQITVGRLEDIPVPDHPPPCLGFPVLAALPHTELATQTEWSLAAQPIPLSDLFDLAPGDYHVLYELPEGSVPVISCGQRDNGIAGYFDVPAPHHRGTLTIALNGSPLQTYYHPYGFAAKDDVAICTPKRPLRVTTLLFIQVMLNRERWRYSYYRKCYIDKLRRVQVQLPSRQGAIDEDTMQGVLTRAPYWAYLEDRLHAAPG